MNLLPERDPQGGIPLESWYDYQRAAERITGRFSQHFQWRYFDYLHPARLQPGTPARRRRPYDVRIAYTDWGAPGLPLLVCCGGIVNTAMRFAFLAEALRTRFRVVCMDWAGRGASGWLHDEQDYGPESYLEQVRQLIVHLGGGPVHLLGSSLGGSVGIALAARWPRLVRRLILNDTGPFIPKARRMRRARTLARFYVFRDPADLVRRIGAAQRDFGPAGEEVRLLLSHYQTRWSDADGGRVYRHDVRALQAYRREAQSSVDQWALWARVRCPVLVIHGMRSDVLLPATLWRMQRSRAIDLMEVPDTGHTPILCDANQIRLVLEWLEVNPDLPRSWCAILADAESGGGEWNDPPRGGDRE